MTPAEQQQRLGSTQAPAQAQTQAAADRNVLDKLGLTAEDLQKAGAAALPHLRQAAESVVQGHPEQALGHLRDAAFASPDVAAKALKGQQPEDCAADSRLFDATEGRSGIRHQAALCALELLLP